ncbi:YdcF family protein [Bacillus sp. 165]|uniref:YdcF family protein n=1 Tax=Bacillus sp. 165 TaxID=1529117 RepID=UPI001FFE23F0|nr:YdcF family protein [Bacillus sp. 165]
MISTARSFPTKESEHLIVLGAKLNGVEPSLALQARLDTALLYLQDHPAMKVIVSGGQGADEDIAEAYAMARYLEKAGIDSKQILLENQSTNTYENIKFSIKKFKLKDAVIVSNGFHLYRVKTIANRLGLEAETLAAPTPAIAKLKSYPREYIAIIKTWLFDK